MPNREELFSAVFYRTLMINGSRILFIIVFAWLATFLIERIIRATRVYVIKAMVKTEGGNQFEVEKRAQTVGSVLRKSLSGVIWLVALMMVLKEMNFDIRPLIAGAGIIGVAFGFGAQNLVKDFLAGFFLLIENQIRVNDVAQINGTGGLVEEINLRTTILRGDDGAVHIFPNGSIQKLANLTRDFSYYVFSIAVDYKEDTDRVISVLQEIAAQLSSEEPYGKAILAPLEVWGVDQLAESGVVVKVRFKTLPMSQWLVGREMNRRIKKRFEEVGIQTAFPTRVIRMQQELTGKS